MEIYEAGNWSVENVQNIVRNYDDSIAYTLKNQKKFTELTLWLNDGLLTCSKEQFSLSMENLNFKSIKNIRKKLSLEESEIFERICTDYKYGEQILIIFHFWKWLGEKGARNIEFRKRDYVLRSNDLGIIIQVGNGNITHILDSFEDGIKKYILVPYYSGTTGEMFVFSSTPSFIEYANEKRKTESEISSFYLRGKQKTIKRPFIIPNINQSIEFEQSDLVEFSNGKRKGIRGIVLENLPSNPDGWKIAKRHYEQEVHDREIEIRKRQTVPESFFNIKDERMKFKWLGEEKPLTEPSLLIKHAKKTSAGVIMEYYIVPTSNIEVRHKLDIDVIFDKTIEVFKRNNDSTLRLNFTQDEDLGSNAAYDPSNHTIIVSPLNLYQLAVKRFIHEGLLLSETVELVIAHELGHADKKAMYLYNDNYYYVVEAFNESNRFINNQWQSFLSASLEKSEVQEMYETLHKLVGLAKEFSKLELQAERDAFEYGRQYLSDYLYPVFEREGYENYQHYNMNNMERILATLNRYYEVKKRLPTYKKSELAFNFDLGNLSSFFRELD